MRFYRATYTIHFAQHRVFQRADRGYRSTKNLITMVYLIAGKLDLKLSTRNSEEPITFSKYTTDFITII